MTKTGAGQRRLPDEDTVRRGPTALVVRLSQAESMWYEKRYDVLWPWVPLAGVVKANVPCLSAATEIKNAAQLLKLGVLAPTARITGRSWAMDCLRLGVRRRSVVRLEPLAGRRLVELLSGAQRRGPGSALSLKARRSIICAVADAVRCMHAGGHFHRDLYLCHLLWDDVQSRPALLDVARAGRRRWRRRRWAVKDLAALLYSSRAWTTRGDQVAFLRAYLGPGPQARLGAERGWAADVVRKAQRLAAHGRKG